jgi:hypothetical protein
MYCDLRLRPLALFLLFPGCMVAPRVGGYDADTMTVYKDGTVRPNDGYVWEDAPVGDGWSGDLFLCGNEPRSVNARPFELRTQPAPGYKYVYSIKKRFDNHDYSVEPAPENEAPKITVISDPAKPNVPLVTCYEKSPVVGYEAELKNMTRSRIQVNYSLRIVVPSDPPQGYTQNVEKVLEPLSMYVISQSVLQMIFEVKAKALEPDKLDGSGTGQ